MPELPEVETVRKGLNQMTLNQPIVGADVLLDSAIAHPTAVEFIAQLTNTTINHWYRRGKYLLAQLQAPSQPSNPIFTSKDPIETTTSDGGWLGVHLRMTGQLLWLTSDQPLHKHTRVRLFLQGERELRFVDQRTFGKIWWVPPGMAVMDVISGLRELGPEPLSDEFSPEYLANKLRLRQRPIKTALLDQAILAGLGNIYADEALFLAGIQPTTPSRRLSEDQVNRLCTHIVEVLQEAIASGGTTIRNFLNVQGVNGNYGSHAWVYQRGGKPCRVCQTPIAKIKLSGRGTHFCPRCQPSLDSDLS
ncbi:MAG: DNA-formamidopyrimidine glycosylase [Limnospira sp. PMC 1286.21]|uniref:DNA-formamidopyrimidine glycosylase n=1 Tax=Limnospira sp. PMC 1286.21 TaxID=2981069 RepID=UPI0028E15820|nr:DNA-formamidopyrimidine glycosylase [Limnospira sp. PMC 1286.21]MDT9328417.1 DNA-formamidopyrimidine glycosylase [Limnospira sp. PMC 1286.21]